MENKRKPIRAKRTTQQVNIELESPLRVYQSSHQFDCTQIDVLDDARVILSSKTKSMEQGALLDVDHAGLSELLAEATGDNTFDLSAHFVSLSREQIRLCFNVRVISAEEIANTQVTEDPESEANESSELNINIAT